MAETYTGCGAGSNWRGLTTNYSSVSLTVGRVIGTERGVILGATGVAGISGVDWAGTVVWRVEVAGGGTSVI